MNEDRPAAHLERALLAGSLLCIGLMLLILTDFEYGRDQGIYAVVGHTILEGGAPYADAWDFKPPMIYFVYALARGLFGGDVHAIRWLEAVSFASLVCAFAILSRRHVGSARAGIVAGLLAVSAHVQLEFWHTAQPESFGAVLTAWALVAATFEPASGAGAQWRARLADLAAGALYTVAALLKPPLGGGFLVSLAFALHAHRSQGAGWRAAASLVAAYVAGAALVLLAVAGFFLAHGAWSALVSALFDFAPHYTALSFRPDELRSLVYRALDASLFHYSAYLPLGLVLLLALPRLSERERSGATHVVLVCAFQIIGIGLQAKFFNYHFDATVSLLALPAGWGLWKLWLRVRGRLLLAGATLLLLLALGDVHVAKPPFGIGFWERGRLRLGLLSGSDRYALLGQLHSLPDYVYADANRRIADWISAHSEPSDTVFIWGFEPGIYELADRRCASRYIYNVPQRLFWPGREDARRELVESLRAHPPAVFAVAHDDDLSVVTGSRRDSAAELSTFDSLRELVERGYSQERRIGSFTLYLRRSDTPGRTP